MFSAQIFSQIFALSIYPIWSPRPVAAMAHCKMPVFIVTR
jgi:hypothetical protein